MIGPGTAALALVAALTLPPAEPEPVRIMPLGDSITHGDKHGSYRTALWEMLVDQDGREIDFVGSQNDGPLPDADHEGHSGWRTDEIEAEAAGWVEEYEPDIVLLHTGTNDLIQGASGEEAAARLDTLLGTLFTADPELTVITASVVPLHDSAANWREYTASVPDVVAVRRDEGRSALFADMSDGTVSGSKDIPDGVHPGPEGSAEMAETWYPLVTAALDALS